MNTIQKEPRNRCPVCGNEFDLEEIEEVFDCKSCGDSLARNLTNDNLIGEFDDYAYCL